MKILILIPPIRDFYFTPHRGSFLGAEIVKRILTDKFKLKCEILNLINLRKKPKPIPLPHYLKYLERYLNRSFFFKNFYHFGVDPSKIKDILIKYSPDAIIISCFAFCYSEESIEIARIIKKMNNKIYLAVGGSGVTVFPEYFENTDLFDLIICGEFETVSENVYYHLINKKSGIVVPDKFTESKDLIFILKPVFSTSKIQYYSTILSRGCGKNCEFCANKLLFGKKMRIVPIHTIENELKRIKFPDKKIFINFEDDNILFQKEYLLDVLNVFKKINPNILFSFENGLDFTMLDENYCEKLIKSGIRQFNFSFVNLNKKILSESNRVNDIEKYNSITNFIKKFQIPIITYIIAGLKHDSFKNLIENILYLYDKTTIIGYSPFYPVPGIKGFENKDTFFNIPPGLMRGSAMYPWNKSLTTEELVKGFNIVRALNRYRYLERNSS